MDNKNFDDAYQSAQKLFEEDALGDENVNLAENEQQNENVNDEKSASSANEEVNAQEKNANENMVVDEAVNTAQAAANIAKEKDIALQETLRENEQLKGAVSQLQETIFEMSEAKKEEIVEEALEIPQFDFNSLAFADEQTQKNAQNKFIEDIAKYVKGSMLKELSPFINEAQEGIALKEKTAAIDDLASTEEFEDIKEMLPQIERVLENNSLLSKSDIPLIDKIVNAYVIVKGIDKMNTPPPAPPKELTAEELLSLYEKNPEFQNLVEQKRISQIKDSQQVPVFSASSGAVNAALNIKEKPKSFDEASERTRKMFGM